MRKKVVVLGGGYAGVLIAKKLEKKLKKKKIDADITIIDKNPFHTMLTELHEVAAFRVEEDSIRLDLKKIFAKRKVNIVTDYIKQVDYGNNKLHGTKDDYVYDYMVLATGCKPTFFGVEGAAENSFTLWSYQDAVKLRYHIAEMFRQAAIELDSEKKRALLSFYVIGCGFTGIEMIGELAEAVPILCRQYQIDPSMITLCTLDLFDRIMPILPEKATNRAMKRLKKMGVNVMLKTTVTHVGSDSITYAPQGKKYAQPVEGQEVTAKSYTVIWAAGTQGSDIVLESSDLGHANGTRNSRIEVDGTCRSLTHRNVYIAGDNMYYIPSGKKKPVPQMVENCEHVAPVVANNIAQELQGKEPDSIYNPTFHGVMVCIGGRYGVANVGIEDTFMIVLPSFLAMLSKHFINMLYFVQVLGWHKIFAYANRQFFAIRNRRSFVGGHFSNRGPLFLSVPLRLWLGGYFVYMAYAKYATGYLNNPTISNTYQNIANSFRPRFFGFRLFERFDFSVIAAYGGQMTVWFRMSIMSRFIEDYVINSPTNQLFWQHTIVIFMLLVGLALMAGLLTTLAAFGIVIYAVFMVLTIGLPISMWWIPLAGLGFMFVGGRVLSIDYWFIPWLKDKWTKIPFIKKWYLYN